MNIIHLDETPSTNSAIRQLGLNDHGTVVAARAQTAGRGQRGNSWEAAPGQNLTFSMLLRPQNICAARQFAISRAVALGILDCVGHWLAPSLAAGGLELKIKWPNDIYAGNRKLCGILIENTIEGSRISRSIAGIGLNVNQMEFTSDAPNPVSMAQLAGIEFDLDMLLTDLATTILNHFDAEDAGEGLVSAVEFSENLWRGTGLHPFKHGAAAPAHALAPGETSFMAEIEGVDIDGTLILRHADGTLSRHAFKEVSFLL